jgi:hypothetical protein
VWDPTSHKVIINKDIVCMEQPKRLIQDRKGKFVCMLDNSLYGLLVARQIYKMFESFIVSHNFSKGRNDYTIYSTFTVLMLFVDDMLDANKSMDIISKKMSQMDRTIQMRDQGAAKQIMEMEVYRDGNGKLWLEFSMNIVKKLKWVLQCLRCTNVTYNGYTEMVRDNCNVYCNTTVLDRRSSITKYVSQHNHGKHVGGGVIPQEIQTRGSHTGEIMKPILLEKLQWCLASLGLQKR